VKRIAFIIVGFAVLSAASFAHAGYAGFKGGVNYAGFTGEDADEFPYHRTGFTGGGFLAWDGGNHLGFRTDLLYTMKGATTGAVPASAEADTFVTSLIKIDYLELGTLLTARFDVSKRFTVRGFVGPVLGLWVNAEADNGPLDVDIGDIVEHWEFSATIGGEIDMKAGPYVLLMEARYTQGSRVFESIGLNGEPLDFNVSNQGIGLMVGMMVPF